MDCTMVSCRDSAGLYLLLSRLQLRAALAAVLPVRIASRWVAPEQLRDLVVATILPHVGLKSGPGTPPLSAHPTEDTCGDGCQVNDRRLAV